MKYRPEFPSVPFTSFEAASEWGAKFVRWYNNEHLHSGINFITPAERHAGEHKETLRMRALVYEAARLRNPERWSGSIRNLDPVETVTLNPNPEVGDAQPAA